MDRDGNSALEKLDDSNRKVFDLRRWKEMLPLRSLFRGHSGGLLPESSGLKHANFEEAALGRAVGDFGMIRW
jgi:hypothetical protein